ncbi:MAG: hypothetical protein H7A24_12660 [Leptospiraceae bacterium]|nr:hypothetical protein [Leptospiraceae bacterium]MCP5512727.1 hypothetical protein [Leptospiraceae bacterium]
MKFFFLIVFLFLGCRNDIQRPPLESVFFPLSGVVGEKAGVISSDFSSGGRFSIIDPGLFLSTPTFANVHSDAVLRYAFGRVYIVNRLNRDSILVLNPDLAFLPEKEYSVGQGSNPQDIAVLNSEKAYVSLYNSTGLLVIHPNSGAVLKTIDLSTYSETFTTGSAGLDGKPEMHRMILHEGYLYLQLQRLDRNDSSGYPAPTSPSYLLKINTSTDLVEKLIQTPYPNPIGKMRIINFLGAPHLFVCLPARLGFLSQMDGGIAAMNLLTDTFRPTLIYPETTAGGDILDMVIQNENSGFAFVLDAYFNKMIQKFDPSTGNKLATLAYYPSSYGNLSGVALSNSGKLYTGDSNFSNPGVMIYDTNTLTRLTPQPIDVGLRPFEIEIIGN